MYQEGEAHPTDSSGVGRDSGHVALHSLDTAESLQPWGVSKVYVGSRELSAGWQLSQTLSHADGCILGGLACPHARDPS